MESERTASVSWGRVGPGSSIPGHPPAHSSLGWEVVKVCGSPFIYTFLISFLVFLALYVFLWCLLAWVGSLKIYRVLKWGGLDCSNESRVFKGKFCLAEAKTWRTLLELRTPPCCMQMVRQSSALEGDSHVGGGWGPHPEEATPHTHGRLVYWLMHVHWSPSQFPGFFPFLLWTSNTQN